MWHPHSNKPQKICRVNHFKINFQPHTAHFCDDKIFRLPVKMTRSLQFFSWYSIPALRLNASIKAVSCNTCNWGKTLLKNDIIIKYELYLQNRGQIVFKQIISSEMPTSGDLKSGDFFWTSPPPPNRICQCNPPPKFFFYLDPPLPLPLPSYPQAILWEKCQSICQGLQLVEYSFNQTLVFIGVTKKKLSSFCLQQKMCIMQENEARNCNTSISQIILEFWNFGTYGL